MIAEMGKTLKFNVRRKIWRNNSKTSLLSKNNNNNNVQDGNGYGAPWAQNMINSQKELGLQSGREILPQELAELLQVVPDAMLITSEDTCWCAVQPEKNLGQHNLQLDVVLLIERYVSKNFPRPPGHLDQLQQHLLHVQEAVVHELVRFGPLLEPRGLMGFLINSYHDQIFDHLHSLLQNVTSTKNSFVLMNWVLNTYQSEEMLGHPDLQEMDPIKKLDVQLVKEWEAKAKEKLLENVQREVRRSLENILQIHIDQKPCNCEEAYVGLYVDTIKCINAMPDEAQKICPQLSGQVQEVCLQELLVFVRSYVAEQTEALGKIAKMDKPETINFLKTLKSCQELKDYVQNKSKGIRTSLIHETVETLENLESITLNLLMEIVAEIAESHFKKYFKSNNSQFHLLAAVEELFPKLSYGLDEQKRVLDVAYKHVVRTYVKHLVQCSQSKLKKCWSPDVGQTVSRDAELLHRTFSDLGPDVQSWNFMLLNISEMLECNSIDALKITVANMQRQCLPESKDMDLLRTLLRWKGLSRRDVKEVLDALPLDFQPRPDPDRQTWRGRSWYSCLNCLGY